MILTIYLKLDTLTHMNNTLESHRLFPYIAWILVIGFAIFTYMLTTRLQQQFDNINEGIVRLETKLDKLETTKETPAGAVKVRN